ncbi:hypothetical protein I656_01127 [Geobacillus sp. WSUCF1]|nr:hypothetical protein I656_01127 [Geobacillus sp. WSUCF1]
MKTGTGTAPSSALLSNQCLQGGLAAPSFRGKALGMHAAGPRHPGGNGFVACTAVSFRGFNTLPARGNQALS